MSASKKLKAMNESNDGEHLIVILQALPQIVAVIEAAERQAALVVDEEPEWKDEELPEALTALDEALSYDDIPGAGQPGC